MIPKRIHYCWFGRGEKPDSVKKCIASWRKFCPDFEIVEWNEENCEYLAVPFMAEAYQEKKYAFVSDVMRLLVLEQYGGVYFAVLGLLLANIFLNCYNKIRKNRLEVQFLGDFKIFEAIMLLCFGISWPISIYKSYTSRKVGSKSIVFLYAILVGYMAGIINKILYSPDIVLALYIINLIMVTIDTVLYYRNVRIEKAQAAKSCDPPLGKI